MKVFNNIPNKSHFIENPNWFTKFVNWFRKIFKISVKGRTLWESRSVAVNAYIFAYFNSENYVLVGQRGIGAPDYRGRWNVPSGYMDWNETGSEATNREVWEETGFDLTKIKKIIVSFLDQPWFVNTDPNENKQNITLRYGVYFHADTLPDLTDENSEPNEIGDLKWLKLDDFHNNNSYKWAFTHDEKINIFENILIENGYIIP